MPIGKRWFSSGIGQTVSPSNRLAYGATAILHFKHVGQRRCFGSTTVKQQTNKPHTGTDGPQKGFSAVAPGRRCIVTGGASGIGFEISKQLVLDGAKMVLVVSRSATKAQDAIAQIKQETEVNDDSIHFAECDFNQGADALLQKWRTISKQSDTPAGFDTLINCAGVSQTSALFRTSPDTVSNILKINLEIPIRLSQSLLKEYFAYGSWLEKMSSPIEGPRSFCIINVSSLLAERGGYGSSIYATSKAGLTAFTRTLTLEAAAIRDKYYQLPPFRANAVVPGYIDTPMVADFSAQQKGKLAGTIPIRRYGTPKEVANAVMFLLKNEYANNTVLNLDGGLSAI